MRTAASRGAMDKVTPGFIELFNPLLEVGRLEVDVFGPGYAAGVEFTRGSDIEHDHLFVSYEALSLFGIDVPDRGI